MNASDLADEVTQGPLPPRVRKVLETAEAEGWVLNGKGASFTMRLDKPDDDLALPFYITWVLGRTEKGALSWRFFSAGTVSLQPMNYDDVLTYLKDPTVIYPEIEDTK